MITTNNIPYCIPFLYMFLMNYISFFYKNLQIEKRYIFYYNLFLSFISFHLLYNSIENLLKYNFYEIICIFSPDELFYTRYIFFALKFIEWFDTIFLILKNNGDLSKINRMHYYHHAIVPTMTYYGIGQPGDIYVLITNNLAHFLMYLYYAYPKELSFAKSFITIYQYIQHLFALVLIIYQYSNGCNINYPFFNFLGYIYFFCEYFLLCLPIFKSIETNAYSSLLFLTNVIHLQYKDDYVYTIIFSGLTLTSVIYHQTKTKFWYVFDKIATYCIVIKGGHVLFVHNEYNISSIITILLFLLVCHIYFYGYLKSLYSFDRNKKISEKYHSLLHLIASIGHHIIIYNTK